MDKKWASASKRADTQLRRIRSLSRKELAIILTGDLDTIRCIASELKGEEIACEKFDSKI
jgi:hypothetical protein